MNWHTTLKTIYSKLRANSLSHIADDLHQRQLMGGTGGEVLDLILSKLIEIRGENPEIYSIIKEEVDELIDYAKSIGYLR